MDSQLIVREVDGLATETILSIGSNGYLGSVAERVSERYAVAEEGRALFTVTFPRYG